MNGGARRLAAADIEIVAGLALLPLVLFAEALTGRLVFYERDIHAYWYPKVEAMVRIVASGAWPLWDPYSGFGLPLLADPGSQVFYPFTWLNLLFLPPTVYTIAVTVHAWWAAAGAYALGREWELSPMAAVVTAVCFAASGPFLSSVSLYHHYMGAAWMPWVLVALEEALARRTRRAAVALGVVAAAQVLAGSGDMVVLTALAGALRVAAALLPRATPRLDARGLGRLALAGGLALGLSAAQWLPTVALLRRSSRAVMATGANLYWSVHPGALLELFLPRALASLPLSESVRAALFEAREPFLPSLYLGLMPALLVVPLAASGSPRRVWLAAAGALFFLTAALGRHTPVLPLLLHLPGFAWFRYPVKYTVGLALFWSLLAGLGAEAWRRSWSLLDRRRGRRRAIEAALVALVALATAEWLRRHAVDLGRWVDAPPDWRPLAYAPLVALLRRAAALALGAAALLWLRARREGRAWAVVVAAAVALDLVGAGRGVNDLAPRALVAHRPPVLDLLAGPPDDHRLYVPPAPMRWLNRSLARGPAGWEQEWSWALGLQDALQPPIGARWGLRGSFDADFTGLASWRFGAVAAMVARYEDTALGLRLLRMGGVTDVLTLRKETAPGLVGVGETPTVFSEPIHVFRVPAPLPRAYLAGQARAAAGDDALRALGDVGFDPTTTVILDADAPLSAASGSGGSARIVEARADRWRVATQSAAAGYLVVLDADDPGWRAAVDGAAAPVRRANLLFRAVEVPAGAHMVEMTYRPPSVSVGLGLSGAAAVVSLALLRRAA